MAIYSPVLCSVFQTLIYIYIYMDDTAHTLNLALLLGHPIVELRHFEDT